MIRIDNRGTGFSQVLEEAETLAKDNGLDERLTAQIRLLTEETMEMVRNLNREFEAEVSATIDNGQFELKMHSDSRMDSQKRKQLQEIVSGEGETREVSGKIRAVLESRYFDETESSEKLFEEMGIRRVEAGDPENMTGDPGGEEYVWSLQNYGFITFDRQDDDAYDNDAEWAEIGRSIIASLSDDLRIYIFRDHQDLIVTKSLSDTEAEHTEWKIDPELEALKKVPVASSRIQVRMVQLLYGGLMKKEKSNDTLTVGTIRIPCDASPRKKLNCLVYAPVGKEKEKLPSVLLLHGGAFVFPALPYHYRLARYVAEHASCRVFMPDYDLAPDYKPPVQHDEAFAVYRFLLDNAEEQLIDPAHLVIMGDSAGGTMCAALCLRLKKEGLPMPAGQLLLYPSLDSRLESKSMKRYTDVPVCNAKAVKAYYKLCRSKTRETPHEYSSPVEAGSLAGMPPTYVETAEFDCLHDDGILYADRLSDEDCEVVLNETKGTVHAFDMAKDSAVLKEAMNRRTDFIKECFQI